MYVFFEKSDLLWEAQKVVCGGNFAKKHFSSILNLLDYREKKLYIPWGKVRRRPQLVQK